MASPEENLALSLQRAAEARAEGNEARALGWDAAAERYRRIISSKQKIAVAAENIKKIQERVSTPPVVIGTPVVSNSVSTNPSKPAPQNINPTPKTPKNEGSSSNTSSRAIKTAPIDTILFNNDDMPIELMFDLIFEDIGGQELINIARNDTINGQNIIYQPIKNLTQIQRQYNPNNILSLQDTMDKYFENFTIVFEDKIPEVGNGPDGSFVYIDQSNGDLVIEVVNFEEDEQLEVNIFTSGTILYEENL
jgi:hypothetical protein